MVLIFSSFTMASAVRAAQLGRRRWLVGLLAVTLVCGFCFLGVKSSSTEQMGGRAFPPAYGPKRRPGGRHPRNAATAGRRHKAAAAGRAGWHCRDSRPDRRALGNHAGGNRQAGNLAPSGSPKGQSTGMGRARADNVQLFFGIYS